MSKHTSIVTRKGQITIPIEMRRELGIHEGDRVEFVHSEGKTLQVVPVSTEPCLGVSSFGEGPALRRIREIASAYHHDNGPATDEELKEAAMLSWTERERRWVAKREAEESY